MKKTHTCFTKMLKPLSSQQSQESYSYKIQRFMKFADEKGFFENQGITAVALGHKLKEVLFSTNQIQRRKKTAEEIKHKKTES